MKKALALFVMLAMLFGAMPAVAAPQALPNSDPISHGKINKVTYLYWGKSEMFPTLALVGPGQEFDVYEYDKDWVMVLYDTWVSQGMSGGGAQSFYCYVKRADITCDPALDGDESPKADTGPGKRKGKKPKPQPTAGASAAPSAATPTEEASAEPLPTVEEQEEYDWIIRTPGVCNVTVKVEGVSMTCSFALMAQKAGGTAPSSDPTYNHGMHTAYAATAYFAMFSTMQDVLEAMGATGYLSGSGGVEITGSTAGSKFYLDTGAEDPALVNFSINLNGNFTMNPMVTDGNLVGQVDMGSPINFPLPVQLKKAGSGYKFVLPGMKPGGGDLTFPAVLEKTFADPDRWDKEAKDADRRRKEAEELRKKLLEKIKEQMKDEYNKKKQDENKDGDESTDPMTVPGEDDPLAPLVTPDPFPSLAPLVTDDPYPSLAPLVTDDPYPSLVPLEPPPPLAPLVPSEDEAVNDFPSGGK